MTFETELQEGLNAVGRFLQDARGLQTPGAVEVATGIQAATITAAEAGEGRLNAATWIRLLRHYKARVPDGICRSCGCFDAWACAGGCEWVEPSLCSSCHAIREPIVERVRRLLAMIGRSRPCTGCGSPIYFFTNIESQQRMPITPEGISHFIDCPKTRSFRR